MKRRGTTCGCAEGVDGINTTSSLHPRPTLHPPSTKRFQRRHFMTRSQGMGGLRSRALARGRGECGADGPRRGAVVGADGRSGDRQCRRRGHGYWLQNEQPFDRDSFVDWMIKMASAGWRASTRPAKTVPPKGQDCRPITVCKTPFACVVGFRLGKAGNDGLGVCANSRGGEHGDTLTDS